MNLVQYSNDSEVAGINSRVHWIPQAGRELFVVLNHNLQDIDLDNAFHSSFADLSVSIGIRSGSKFGPCMGVKLKKCFVSHCF